MTAPKPTPIRRPERIWHEVKCPYCDRYLCKLTPGSEIEIQCKCKRMVRRSIPVAKAA